MMYPLVLDLADDAIPVTVTCRVLGFSKQAFYQWKRNPVSDRDYDDAYLINAAIDTHHDDSEFGDRFIADERAAHCVTASRNWGRPAVHHPAAALVDLRPPMRPPPTTGPAGAGKTATPSLAKTPQIASTPNRCLWASI